MEFRGSHFVPAWNKKGEEEEKVPTRDGEMKEKERESKGRWFSFSNLIRGRSKAGADKRRKERCPSPAAGKGQL